MYVTLQSSTCFEYQHAHLQEDKLYYHRIWYCHSLYSCLQRVTISDAVLIQFVLLKMGMLMLKKHVEDCNVTYILLKNKGIVH